MAESDVLGINVGIDCVDKPHGRCEPAHRWATLTIGTPGLPCMRMPRVSGRAALVAASRFSMYRR